MSKSEEKVKVNSYGTNVKIKYHILPDKEMIKAGFCKVEDLKCWYYCEIYDKDITFNVTIPFDLEKNEGRVQVIDEDFGQPYDYQYYIAGGKNVNEFALKVRDFVEEEMEKLQKAGILSGHVRGEYI